MGDQSSSQPVEKADENNMGLFDGYFDPSTYQGSSGLIDRLLAQIGTQNQYQPTGQDFPPAPMDANALKLSAKAM